MKVLLSTGNEVEVSKLKIGDILIGADSKPRVISELFTKTENLFKIIPKKGEDFIISESEALFLMRAKGSLKMHPEQTNLKPMDYLSKNSNYKARYCLCKTSLQLKETKPLIPPYIMGLWLGDGTSSNFALTSMDNEPSYEFSNFIKNEGLSVNINQKLNNKASTITATGKRIKVNHLLIELRELGILDNKNIPEIYLLSSREQRLELLAGLIDTDGSLTGNNGYEIIQKSNKLSEQIVFLARSLGFAAYVKKSEKNCQNGFIGTYNRIIISGNTELIKVRIPRKLSKPRKQEKNELRLGFSIEPLGLQEHITFSFSCGNSDYVDSNFFIRNCIKKD